MNETGKMSRQQECVQKLKEWRLQWEGWQEYFKFWDGFVQTWFECKENNPDALPDDSLTRCLSPLFNVQNKDVRLSKDELPEPYCIDPSQVGIGNEFDPQKIGLVIIQMNPAAAQDKDENRVNLEAAKYYSNKDNDEGFLIRDFENQCKKKFSEWVNRWSFFKTVYPQVGSVPPDESEVSGVSASKVCGHDWWHEENRTGWFKSFAGCELNRVFALETIPYHSKNFEIEKSFQDDEFKKHFLGRVLLPAGICAQSSRSKVVVCCGTKLREFLGRLEELEIASKIFTWEKKRNLEELIVSDVRKGAGNLRNGRESLEKCWPTNNRERWRERWYELYCCEIPYCEQEDRKVCKFLILSIYANSMKFPGRDFRGRGVEKLLKERIGEAMMDFSPETHSEDGVNLFASRLATATELQRQASGGVNERKDRQLRFWESLFDNYPFNDNGIIRRRGNQRRPEVSYQLRRGVQLTFVFNQQQARIECNIDRRADGVYNQLLAQRPEIETAVKYELIWEQRTPNGGAGRSRVSLQLNECSIAADADWQRVCEWFCTYMPVFERAICGALQMG